MGTVCRQMIFIHKYMYKWTVVKLMWVIILLNVHISIYIYIIIGTDNTQNDCYLQIHVHIYG